MSAPNRKFPEEGTTDFEDIKRRYENNEVDIQTLAGELDMQWCQFLYKHNPHRNMRPLQSYPNS